MEYGNDFNLEGKVAFINGASGILGPHFCHALRDYGAKVFATDVNDKVMDMFSNENNITPFICDISDPANVNEAVSKCLSEFGHIDILHNNAQGKTYSVPFEEYTLDMWRETTNVNVDGYFLCAQAVGKHMVERGQGGSVIQTASIYGAMAPDFRIYDGIKNAAGKNMSSPAVYSASKAAVIGLTRYLASYWAPHGIRVNNLIPGGVEFQQEEQFKANYSSRIPLGRMANPKDMVGAMLFLASDAAGYVTGQDLFVDGGLHVW